MIANDGAHKHNFKYGGDGNFCNSKNQTKVTSVATKRLFTWSQMNKVIERGIKTENYIIWFVIVLFSFAAQNCDLFDSFFLIWSLGCHLTLFLPAPPSIKSYLWISLFMQISTLQQTLAIRPNAYYPIEMLLRRCFFVASIPLWKWWRDDDYDRCNKIKTQIHQIIVRSVGKQHESCVFFLRALYSIPKDKKRRVESGEKKRNRTATMAELFQIDTTNDSSRRVSTQT